MTSKSQNTKEMIEILKREFQSKTGKELTKQELLDRCLQFVFSHSNAFLKESSHNLKLTKEKIEKIISKARNDKLYYEDKSDDDLIYGL